MSSIKSTQIDGDVSVSRNAAVGGDVTVQGKTHLKGNVKIEGWLEAKKPTRFRMTVGGHLSGFPYLLLYTWVMEASGFQLDRQVVIPL